MSEVYLGNPNLKKANTPIEFTQENILEFLKCKDDPVYFANNHIKIVSLDDGLVPFKYVKGNQTNMSSPQHTPVVSSWLCCCMLCF